MMQAIYYMPNMQVMQNATSVRNSVTFQVKTKTIKRNNITEQTRYLSGGQSTLSRTHRFCAQFRAQTLYTGAYKLHAGSIGVQIRRCCGFKDCIGIEIWSCCSHQIIKLESLIIYIFSFNKISKDTSRTGRI